MQCDISTTATRPDMSSSERYQQNEQESDEIGEFCEFAIAITSALRDQHSQDMTFECIQPCYLIKGENEEIQIKSHVVCDDCRNSKKQLKYNSPEASGRINESVDQRSDLYSL